MRASGWRTIGSTRERLLVGRRIAGSLDLVFAVSEGASLAVVEIRAGLHGFFRRSAPARRAFASAVAWTTKWTTGRAIGVTWLGRVASRNDETQREQRNGSIHRRHVRTRSLSQRSRMVWEC